MLNLNLFEKKLEKYLQNGLKFCIFAPCNSEAAGSGSQAEKTRCEKRVNTTAEDCPKEQTLTI